MKKIFCAYILLLMCLGTWAQGGRKMSYDIRRMASQYSQVRRTASANSDKKPESVRAMIRFQSSEAEAVMARYGCRYLSRIGDIYVADIPVAQLQAMADDERVVRIENHQGGKLLMDVSPQWINTPAIANDTRLPQAYTGQGVMLGIIDIGIEVGHPNFYTADGSRLRITRFLDQLASEDESFGEMIPLGREYVTEADIKAKAYACSCDTAYHGTHTLGIAAGSGYTTPYRGIAYEAEVTAVDSKEAGGMSFSSANEVLLMQYIFNVADARSMPCVITYSIGFNALPGDNQLFEQALSQMTGPGHILVTSAGNESADATYLGKKKGVEAVGGILGTREKTDSITTAFICSHDNFKLKFFNISFAPEGSTGGFVYDSLEYVPSDGLVKLNLPYRRITVEKVDTFYTITCLHETPKEDDLLSYLGVVIEGKDCEAQMTTDLCTHFEVSNTFDPRFLCAENTHNVCLPGCLPSAITVGALNTRSKFVNFQGDSIESWGNATPIGSMALFSSQGPTLDGLIKPDVVVPGVNIIASANSHYADGYSKMLVKSTPFEGRDYPWVACSGTSMATPMVAGIVALWLQANPELSPDDVKRIIRETSHPIGDTVPNNTYGYGLMDAYAGLLDILGLPNAIAQLSQHQPSALTIRPADGGIRLQFDQAPTQPFCVRIYTLSGQLLGEHSVRPTAVTDYLLPLTGASGITVVQVNSSEPGITGSELIRKAR